MTADSPEAFRRKNDAQFEAAAARIHRIAHNFIVLVATDLVKETPGYTIGGTTYGNQKPDDTRYVPTGRLRGGWNWRATAQGTSGKGYKADRGSDGPFSLYGDETIHRIMAQVPQRPGGISYIENDVSYGSLIVRGEEGHAKTGPRNWPAVVAGRQAQFARLAQSLGEP